MKWLTLILSALLLMILAAAAAPMFRNDPGYVLIRFKDWTAETSVLVLLLGLLLIYLLIRLIAWLWNWPSRTMRKTQQLRAQKQLEKGLLALSEGDWQGAEKALAKSRSQRGQETVKYLAAARAAQAQSDTAQRDAYLQQAQSGGGKNRFLVELSRAKLLIANGDVSAAISVLQGLQSLRGKHPQVLELLAQCYRDQGNWQELRRIIPALLKTGLVDSAEAQRLKHLSVEHDLKEAQDLPVLNRRWKKLPAGLRKETDLVLSYARQALDLGASDQAESALRSGLKQAWDGRLLRLYAKASKTSPSDGIKQCEKWLQDHPDDGELHLCLGNLCAGEQLWGKARSHFQKSIELSPGPDAYEALGTLMEKQGELEVAMICFQNALRMNRNETPVEVPVAANRRLEAQTPASLPDYSGEEKAE